MSVKATFTSDEFVRICAIQACKIQILEEQLEKASSLVESARKESESLSMEIGRLQNDSERQKATIAGLLKNQKPAATETVNEEGK